MTFVWVCVGLLAWAVVVTLLCSLFRINPRESDE